MQIVHKTVEKRGPSMTHRQDNGSSASSTGRHGTGFQETQFSVVSQQTNRRKPLNPHFQNN